jgi:Cro/C1-type HTH DNA-binding domain
MILAYSRLKSVLEARKLTVPELHRRMQGRGWRVNLKSLYRLSNEQEPLERLDLRVAGAICEICRVPLSELISFGEPRTRLRRLAAIKQRRLESLMAKNNEGKLSPEERAELQALVREAEEITRENAQSLADQRQRLATR